MTEAIVSAEAANWPLLVEEGIAARSRIDGAQWWLGDLAVKVETTYGEQSLQRYAEEIGVNYDNLRKYRHVAQAYPTSVLRSANLSWSHYQRLVSREDRHAWLSRATANHWSWRQMIEAIEQEEESLARMSIASGEVSSPERKGVNKTRQAVATRRQQVRDMAKDGYRPSAIASVVGIGEERVRHQLRGEGIETVEDRIGSSRRIDVTKAMDSLVGNAAPSEIALAAIFADWDDLDRECFPEWMLALNKAAHLYRRLHDRLQKG